MDDVPPRSNWRVATPTPQPLSSSTEGLLETDTDALPVRITIVQDGVTTGWDDGAIGFDEDALWFSGRACSFYIGAQDVLPGAYRQSTCEAVTDAEVLSEGIPLRHSKRRVWIRVQLLYGEGPGHEPGWQRLASEVKRLRGLSQGRTPSQYPPLTPRPGLLGTPQRRRQAKFLRGAGAVGALAVVTSNAVGQPDLFSGIASVVLQGTGMALLLLVLQATVGAVSKRDLRFLERIREEEQV